MVFPNRHNTAMSDDPLLYSDDEPGFIIAWRAKYEFDAGRLAEKMTYAQAIEKCRQLREERPDRTFWPQRADQISDSYGKFHQAH